MATIIGHNSRATTLAERFVAAWRDWKRIVESWNGKSCHQWKLVGLCLQKWLDKR
jgi:hypothetical protein